MFYSVDKILRGLSSNFNSIQSNVMAKNTLLASMNKGILNKVQNLAYKSQYRRVSVLHQQNIQEQVEREMMRTVSLAK